MSLHLGSDFVISSRQIVGVFELSREPSDNPELKIASKTGAQDRIRHIGPGPYRSAVVCTKGTIYYSPIEAATLARRIQAGMKLSRVPEEAYGKDE